MSAPRAARGGGTTSGRSTPPPGSRGRGALRGSASQQFRGGGGRGSGAPGPTNPKAEGLLQGLQSGSLNKKPTTQHDHPPSGRGKMIPFTSLRKIVLQNRATSMPQAHLTQPNPLFACSGNLPIKGRTSTPRGPSRSTRGRGNLSNASTTPFARPSSQAGNMIPAQSDNTARYSIVSHTSDLVY